MKANPKQNGSRRTGTTDRRYRDRDVLEKAYLSHNEDARAVADEFGVAPSTIRRWLVRFDLLDPRERERPTNDTEVDDYPWHDRDELQRVYDECEGEIVAVADHFGIHESTAQEVLVRYDVHERQSYGSHKLEDLNPEDVGLSPLGSTQADRELVTDGGRPTPEAGGGA